MLRSRPLLRPIVPLVLALVVPTAGGEPTENLENLLRTRDTHRVAHLTEDLELWTASLRFPLVNLDGGSLMLVGESDFRAMMGGYFDRVEIIEWDDEAVPFVSMSRDGSQAVVHVVKRVRSTSGSGRADARYAWTEIWSLESDGWKMTAITSTDRTVEPSGSAGDLVEATRVLEKARRWAGYPAAVTAAMASYDANCEGPRGPYTMSVMSSRDGRFNLRQQRPHPASPFAIARTLEDEFLRSATAETGELSDQLLHFAYGHEWALLAIAPEARYRALRYGGTGAFDGARSETIAFDDPLGGVVRFHFHEETHRPLGFVLESHDENDPEPIETYFRDWEPVDGLRLPSRVEVRHGEEKFRCSLIPNRRWILDADFGYGR